MPKLFLVFAAALLCLFDALYLILLCVRKCWLGNEKSSIVIDAYVFSVATTRSERSCTDVHGTQHHHLS